MKLADFKRTVGVENIEFNRFNEGKRAFADVVTPKGDSIRLYLSSKVDMKKPLSVFKGAHDALWVANEAKAIETIKL